MKIIVPDTITAMRSLLNAPVARRPELLTELLAPVAAMYQMPPGYPQLDQVAMHHQGYGFRVDRDDERYLPALDRLERVDALGQIRRCLQQALDHQLAATPDLTLPAELNAVLVLGDPGDPFFTDVMAGHYGIGNRPGCLLVIVWPQPRNEQHLGHVAVHELHHNLRYATVQWNPATVTVGEQVVAEGLAEAYVCRLYGTDALSPYAEPARGDETAYATVVANLGVTGMRHLGAYVHGDETTRRMGGEPVGLPTGAGYAAGLRLVDAHLAATGLSVAESTVLPADEIIRNALSGHATDPQRRTQSGSVSAQQ